MQFEKPQAYYGLDRMQQELLRLDPDLGQSSVMEFHPISFTPVD